LADAKKVYPDLLFVEQIPRTDPKFLYYRRKTENKKFSGLDWNIIRYVFTNDKVFVAAMECADRRYFGSIRTPAQVYDQVLEFLMRNYGRKLREVMDARIDISYVIQ
jgi:hypothetical protein